MSDKDESRIPLYAAQPATVVPDGYVMVPMRLTAENGAKERYPVSFQKPSS